LKARTLEEHELKSFERNEANGRGPARRFDYIDLDRHRTALATTRKRESRRTSCIEEVGSGEADH